MGFDQAVWIHVLLGSVALALFWRALTARKGSDGHRWAGRRFFVVLLGATLSVGPVLFLRPAPFDPGQVVQMVYLSLCVATVTTIGWTAIRWKSAPERFGGRHFRVLGPLLALLGGVVLVAGVADRDPVAVVLSWVGLAYGAAMVHFARRRAPLHPRWWLVWHLHAVCGLFTAVHGTLLFVAWRALADAGATRADAAVCHLAVLVAALALRHWLGRRHAVPWSFTAAGSRLAGQL